MITLELLCEATIDQLTTTAVSNFTQKQLDKREKEGNSRIEVAKSTWYADKDFYEITFFAESSYGATSFIASQDTNVKTPNGWYTVVIRFYKVNRQSPNFQPGDFETLQHSELQKILKAVVHNCDAKFYSDDPSWYWQGCWEDMDKQKMSIFKFTGTKGKGVWRGIHQASGGLTNPNIRLTKHIAQIVRDIDLYIPKMEQLLEVQ